MTMALLAAFWLTIVTAVLYAAALSWTGIHLAARDLSLKSVVLAQATQIGTLIGVLLFHGSEFPILICGTVFSLVIYGFDLSLINKFQFGKSAILLSIFVFLLGASHWLVAFFPGLEKHASQTYFGDIVTITGFQQTIAIAVAISTLVFLTIRRKEIVRVTFDQATYLPADQDKTFTTSNKIFLSVAFVLLVTGIFSLGFIFTIGCLLIPTTVLNIVRTKNAKSHEALCLLVSATGSLIGFTLSLIFENVSTAPTILAMLVLVALAARFAK